MNLGQFLGLPMMAGPRDIPMGEDELGNILYAAGGTPSGQRYTKKTAPANRASVVKALVKGAKAKPWETVGNLVTGAAQGAWDAVAAPGRAAAGEPITMGDVLNTAGLVSLPALAGKYDPAVANMGIRAYHGSPHDFDRFDLSKIGTGEGAQAYGHGLYFAESEGVARSYRNNLTDDFSFGIKTEDGDIFDPKELSNLVADELGIRLGDDVGRSGWEWAFRNFAEQGGIDGLDASRMADDFDRAGYEAAESALRDAAGVFSPQYPGRMYEVDINADPADFLDWDAPLSEQPAKVVSAAEKAGLSANFDLAREADAAARMVEKYKGTQKASWVDPELSRLQDELRGAQSVMELRKIISGAESSFGFEMPDVRDMLAKLPEGYLDPNAPSSLLIQQMRDGRVGSAENALREAGIPGIKYYDQGSRAGKEGTRNYVVFDDSLIEILRKYGLAGAAPLGAILGTQDDEKQRIRDFLTQ